MSNVINALLAPFEFLFGEFGLFTSSGQDGDRRQAMLYGLPAAIIAIVGCILLIIAELTSGQSLEDRYLGFAEGTREIRDQAIKQIKQEIQMGKSSQSPGQTLDQIIPPDDERRLAYRSALQEEEIYLKKLASLNTDEPEYLFRLANIAFSLGHPEKGRAIMQRLAPVDSPGYVDAHLFLAEGILGSKVKNINDMRRSVYLAHRHLDQALLREPLNLRAISMKAQLYDSTKQFADARDEYEKLFELEPRMYSKLYELNKLQKMADKNPDVLQSAVIRFDRQLTDGNPELEKRITILSYLVDCYLRLGDFDKAELKVNDTLRQYPGDSSVKIWANRFLSDSQFGRYNAILDFDNSVFEKKIGHIAAAYEFYPNNTKVLRELARLIDGPPNVRDAAAKIYDPREILDAPAVVDNQLGVAAMARSDYEIALKHLMRAVNKSPRDPEFLNNLAFANLKRTEPDPEQALKLVDQALRYIPPNSNLDRFRSNFQDTKGSALMMLGQYNLAIGEFLKATKALLEASDAFLEGPPDSHQLAERNLAERRLVVRRLENAKSLRDCYKATGKEQQFKVWDERVQQLEALAQQTPDQPPSESPVGP